MVLPASQGTEAHRTHGQAASGAGPTINGEIAVVVGFIVALIIAVVNTKRANA